MKAFEALIEAHFAFFTQLPERRDPEIPKGIKRALDDLIGDLASAWGTNWESHVGNINKADRGAWAVLWKPKPGNAPHLTVAIVPEGLQIFANVENDRAYKQFVNAWKRRPDGLVTILRQLGRETPDTLPDFSVWKLAVDRRWKASPRPRDYKYWPAVDIALVRLAKWRANRLRWFIEESVKRDGEPVPEIMIRRTYPAAEVPRYENLVALLVNDAVTLEPFFEWIGEPIR